MYKHYGSVNNWLIDIPSGSIIHLVTGERKRLGEYQLKLLDVLMKDAGRIFTREELMTLVWEGRVIGNNSLPNAIHALRMALEDDGKQQKIIKTIPKKGYVLEPEYCRFVKEKTEEDDALAEELTDTPSTKVVLTEPQVVSIEPALDVPDSASSPYASWFQHTLIIILLLALSSLCSAALMRWRDSEYHSEKLEVKEIQANVYSNIHIYIVANKSNPTREPDNLYSKLKDTLYTLDQQLKDRSTTMNLYFSAGNQTLNYTFSMTNRCDNNQLVMTIYHWRIDPLQLNRLILRETRRKLDEMASCKEG